MELEFTVEERVFLSYVPRMTRGIYVGVISLSLDALEALEFTDEERESFGIRQSPMPDGMTQMILWDPKSASTVTTVKLSPRVLEWLHGAAHKFTNWPTRPCIRAIFKKLDVAKKNLEE